MLSFFGLLALARIALLIDGGGRLISRQSFQCLLIERADIFQQIENGAFHFGLYQGVRLTALLLLHLYRLHGRNGH